MPLDLQSEVSRLTAELAEARAEIERLQNPCNVFDQSPSVCNRGTEGCCVVHGDKT